MIFDDEGDTINSKANQVVNLREAFEAKRRARNADVLDQDLAVARDASQAGESRS